MCLMGGGGAHLEGKGECKVVTTAYIQIYKKTVCFITTHPLPLYPLPHLRHSLLKACNRLCRSCQV